MRWKGIAKNNRVKILLEKQNPVDFLAETKQFLRSRSGCCGRRGSAVLCPADKIAFEVALDFGFCSSSHAALRGSPNGDRSRFTNASGSLLEPQQTMRR
jgi:hypothetical protein